MMKRVIGAVVAAFVVIQILDFLVHGVLLKATYEASATLWRPEAEMKMGLMFFTSLCFVIAFVLIFHLFFKEKSVKTGTLYGAIFGLGIGISMGYGMYAVMPMPYILAFGWCFGALLDMTVAGAVIGGILKD